MVVVGTSLRSEPAAPGQAGPTFEELGFVEWWNALPPGQHTVAGTVKLRRDLDAPQLGDRRTLWLRLPSSYFDSERAYPVIVMHDGQNLFDEATSFLGEEWRVDETLLALEPELEAIVVGVENGGARRLQEYNPWPADTRAGDYLAFLTDTVLPLVRLACAGRTLDEPTQTLILGSSLGALISLYAYFKRPDVFGLCGAMSPPTWQRRLIPYLAGQRHIGGRIYVDHGRLKPLGPGDNADVGCDGQAVRDALLRAGYRLDHDLFYRHDDGAHDEHAWAARLPEALRLLFPVSE
ncbi:MAG TPA: alpha/beta hydrolase-fold protein [Nitrolancea sp.]|nr:alpha/beta hydrolase-fold protein [Nitrolancea sp.]